MRNLFGNLLFLQLRLRHTRLRLQPDAWEELWKKSEAACLKASSLKQAKSNIVLDFEAVVVRVVNGRFPQPHMNNAMTTVYCLYDKKTGKTEIAEPSAPDRAVGSTRGGEACVSGLREFWWPPC